MLGENFEMFHQPKNAGQELQPLKGTTAVSLKFKGGTVLVADRRVSAGTFIASKRGQKVFRINDSLGAVIAGIASDAMALVDLLRAEIQIFELEQGFLPTVKIAANLLGTILHGGYRRYQPYIALFILSGVDQTGPHVYYLDYSGAVGEEDFTAIGSGSPVAMGLLEASYKDDLTKEEGYDLAIRSLKAAIGRDAATGNGIDALIFSEEDPKIEERKIDL